MSTWTARGRSASHKREDVPSPATNALDLAPKVGLGDLVSKHSDPWGSPAALERLACHMTVGRTTGSAKNHVAWSARTRLGRDGVTELARAYSAGETSKSLAKRMGVSKQSVVKLLREEGVVIRNQPLTEHQRAEAVQHYESGKSVQQVATKLGCDYETVRRVLLERGVAMRSRNGA